MFTSDDYKAIARTNNVLSEAYTAVYAQNLSESVEDHAVSHEPEGQMVEAFDVIAQHLYVEGYASTIEAAEVMAKHISEEWAEQILAKGV